MDLKIKLKIKWTYIISKKKTILLKHSVPFHRQKYLEKPAQPNIQFDILRKRTLDVLVFSVWHDDLFFFFFFFNKTAKILQLSMHISVECIMSSNRIHVKDWISIHRSRIHKLQSYTMFRALLLFHLFIFDRLCCLALHIAQTYELHIFFLSGRILVIENRTEKLAKRWKIENEAGKRIV